MPLLRRRVLAATLAALAGILVLALVRWRGPTPEDAPPGAFSAIRAREVLVDIVEGGEPRVVGSKAQARARDVAADRLRRAGFDVETQHGFACSHHGTCGFVENVIGVRPGRDGRRDHAVLLVAHLDSVAAGPGAGDDGLGAAAVLETARALGVAPPLERAVVVLLSDGEEAGLLGALAFAKGHPLARDADYVVNLDARGTTGPSMLFELSGGRGVVSLVASALRRPTTASLFGEVYRRMPNDTDFSVFRSSRAGVNFGNVAGVERYHTSRDDLSAVDDATLQHHGEQALAMVRAFAAHDAAATPSGDAVWFDVMSFFVVRWPSELTVPLAGVACVLIAVSVWRAKGVTLFAVATGALTSLAVLVAGIVGTIAIAALLRAASALPAPWVAHPVLLLVTLHGSALLAALAVHVLRLRRAGDDASRSIWLGTWMLIALLGLAAAIGAPGASYLFVVPALVAGAAGLARRDVGVGVSAVVLGVLWLPLAWPLYVVLGAMAPPALTLPVLVVSLAVMPLVPPVGGRVLASMALVVVVCAIALVAQVPFSEDVPQRVNVIVRQDDEGPAWVMASAAWGPMRWGPVPPPIAEARGASERRMAPLRGHAEADARAAPRIAALPPEVTREERTRYRVRSRRGADVLAIELPAGASVRVEGEPVAPRDGLVFVRGVPAGGVRIDVDAARFTVADVTRGVGACGLAEAMVHARPREAAPSQDGDVTVLATSPGEPRF